MARPLSSPAREVTHNRVPKVRRALSGLVHWVASDPRIVGAAPALAPGARRRRWLLDMYKLCSTRRPVQQPSKHAAHDRTWCELDQGFVPFGPIEAPLELGARSEGVLRQRHSQSNAPLSSVASGLEHLVLGVCARARWRARACGLGPGTDCKRG